MTTQYELLEQLKTGVVEYDDDRVRTAAEAVLEAGYDPLVAILDGLAAGMEEVGARYERQEYFVPEVLMCADSLYVGMNILRPHVPKQEKGDRLQIVIGTVQGDVHDIGKNLVKMMFDVAGWQVHDLGHDVELDRFAAEQERTGADVVALSAMMTTTMLGMKRVIQMVKEKHPDVLIMVGGAPVTQDVATLFGADGYAESAGNAVVEAVRLIGKLRELRKAG